MGLKDQFNRLRNYFMEDDDDDYDYDEAYEEQEETPTPVESAAAAPVERSQVQVRPQAVQVKSHTQEVDNTQAQTVEETPSPSPATTRPIQQPVQPSYRTNRSAAGTNSGHVSPTSTTKSVASLSRATNMTASSTINIKEPRVYQDIMELATVVKAGQSVLINFKNMADQQARRSIDFLTGVAYVVDGDIQNIGGQIFLVTPTGVTVEGTRELSMMAGSQAFENFDLTY